jgi:hypothetical protein
MGGGWNCSYPVVNSVISRVHNSGSVTRVLLSTDYKGYTLKMKTSMSMMTKKKQVKRQWPILKYYFK